MIVIGPCWACGSTFSFNAEWVPSIEVDGVLRPLCKTCMDKSNVLRAEHGDKPHHIHPMAYEAGP